MSDPSKGNQTREEIVTRALQIAAHKGLGGLTIGTLAKKLKMSKSGLFVHFGSKESLEAAVVERAGRSFLQPRLTSNRRRRFRRNRAGVGPLRLLARLRGKRAYCRAAISLPEHSFCVRDRRDQFRDRSNG